MLKSLAGSNAAGMMNLSCEGWLDGGTGWFTEGVFWLTGLEAGWLGWMGGRSERLQSISKLDQMNGLSLRIFRFNSLAT